MGGTLDISTFAYSLRHLSPCTFNVAIDLRTRVLIRPFREGAVKVSSRGFKSAEYPVRQASYDHPLGLMFAVASFFDVDGIHIAIESPSPLRSGLGGSSAAAVALVGALAEGCGESPSSGLSLRQVAMIAHQIEGSLAGVPCGTQDQLAAAYGGVHAWYWNEKVVGSSFRRKTVIGKPSHDDFQRHILLAYCGIPHASAEINGKWVAQFLSGRYRGFWEEIVQCTRAFVDALLRRDYAGAGQFMNREVGMRRDMTPDVLDPLGETLVDAAVENGCGARFTGAGGGGCLWAIGPVERIERLRGEWALILSARKEATLMDARIDSQGLIVDWH